METTQQKVYLLSASQRDALLSYLQERPYKEVANGIQFLLNAPTATLNVQSNEDGDTLGVPSIEADGESFALEEAQEELPEAVAA